MNNSPQENADVLLVGRYFCDLVFIGLPEFPRLGHEIYSHELKLVPGGVATPAIALSRLGLNVAWPCEFGSDPFSQFVKTELIKEGVNQDFFKDLPNPLLRITVAFSFDNERAFLSYIDPLPKLPYAEIIRKTNPKWVYITHLLIGSELDEIVLAVRSVNAKIFMDCQAHQSAITDPVVINALRSVDVFSPNAEEASVLTGKENIESALEELTRLTPLVIIKQGSRGCLARQAGVVMHSDANPVDVKDTTGAGDNFNCGFLYGQIKGYPLDQTLRIANICGGLSTRGYGGSAASPTSVEINDWL